MHNLTRTQAKRMARLFRVGDLVTWGHKVKNHRVVEISTNGVWVDVTDEENAVYFASRRVGDRLDLLVRFDGNTRSPSGRGPITLVSREERSRGKRPNPMPHDQNPGIKMAMQQARERYRYLHPLSRRA